jgi:hypothetical protein
MPECDSAQVNLQLFPSFRPGVNYFRNSGDEIYIGFRHRGLAIISKSATLDRIFELLTGRLSVAEIIAQIRMEHSGTSQSPENISAVEVSKILIPLIAYEFIDLLADRIQVGSARELLSQSFINREAKLKPELNLHSWSSKYQIGKQGVGKQGVGKQGVSAASARDRIADRAEFSILIFGKNRLATTLLTLLQASGFNRSKMISRSQGLVHRSQNGAAKSRKVTTEQVCGLGIRSSDVGLDFDAVISDISNGVGPNTLDRATFPAIPSFIIAAERAQPDYVQRWMSEGVPYLLISDLIETQIEIGPIVIPGQSPCAFCLELWRSENNPLVQKLDLLNSLRDPLELPASAVATIAGMAVLATTQFAATGKSRLIGSSVRINLLEPTHPEAAHFRPHSGCGCVF